MYTHNSLLFLQLLPQGAVIMRGWSTINIYDHHENNIKITPFASINRNSAIDQDKSYLGQRHPSQGCIIFETWYSWLKHLQLREKVKFIPVWRVRAKQTHTHFKQALTLHKLQKRTLFVKIWNFRNSSPRTKPKSRSRFSCIWKRRQFLIYENVKSEIFVYKLTFWHFGGVYLKNYEVSLLSRFYEITSL